MRGQSAVEYLIIFSAVLVIFAAVTFGQMINPTQEAGRDALYLSQAKSAADAIAGAMDSVYANGRGAVKTVSFTMDSVWDLELDNAEDNLKITVRTSPRTEENQVGDNPYYDIENYHSLSDIPSGTYTVIVEWPEDVSVPENLDDSAIGNRKIFIYLRPRGR